MAGAHRLETNPVHLGRGATVEVEPAFTGMDWYAGYGARRGGDGAEGRLVSLHRFAEPWDSWEMHPVGAELVLCVEGALTLWQEQPGGAATRIDLAAGEYAVNPPGVWHTADVAGPCAALFITAGEGTQNRLR